MKRNKQRLQVIWSPKDFQETEEAAFEQHAADAIELTKSIESREHAKAIHPATVSKQLPPAQVGDVVELTARPCTVTNLFTRSRVR